MDYRRPVGRERRRDQRRGRGRAGYQWVRLRRHTAEREDTLRRGLHRLVLFLAVALAIGCAGGALVWNDVTASYRLPIMEQRIAEMIAALAKMAP